ncbi:MULTISPECIES: AAA family ATPase [unclassified Kribbella]|uniref:AAA family ATPase n=1 Tax=unclassified Kribbella TaxID=2644121 RepID=UPI0030789AEB
MADTRSAAGEGSERSGEPRVPNRDQPAQELANLIAQSDAKGKGFWRRRRRKSATPPVADGSTPAAGTTPAAEPEPETPDTQTADAQAAEAAEAGVDAASGVKAEADNAAETSAADNQADTSAGAVEDAKSSSAADDPTTEQTTTADAANKPVEADAAPEATTAGDAATEAPTAERAATDVPAGGAAAEVPAGDARAEVPAAGDAATEVAAAGDATAEEPAAETDAAATAEAEPQRPTVGVVYEPDESPDGFPMEFANIIVGLPKKPGATNPSTDDPADPHAAPDQAEADPAPTTADQPAAPANPAGGNPDNPGGDGTAEPTQPYADTANAEQADTEAASEGAESPDEQPAGAEAEAASEQPHAEAGQSGADTEPADTDAAPDGTESADDQSADAEAESASEQSHAEADQSGADDGQSGTGDESSDAQAASDGAGSADEQSAEAEASSEQSAEAEASSEQSAEAEASSEQSDAEASQSGADADQSGAEAEQADAEAAADGAESADAHTDGAEAEASSEQVATEADQSGADAEQAEAEAAPDGAESADEQSAGAEAEGSPEHADADQSGGDADQSGSGDEPSDAQAAADGAESTDEQSAGTGAEASSGDAGAEGNQSGSDGQSGGDAEEAGAEAEGARSADGAEAEVVEELSAEQMAERVAAEQAAMALITALMRLRGALAASQLPIDVVGADEARQQQKAMLDQLDDYILPRLVQLEAPVLAVVGGSTGAGKSTLVNTIIGKVVSEPGVLRPTTRSPVLIHHPADAEWFAGDRVLPGMARSSGDKPGGMEDPGQLRLVAADTVPQGLAILDAPDIDSVVEANRDLATQLLAAADLWLFVTTAARYADAVPWDFLQSASDRSTAVAVVLDRAPEDTIDDITGHLAQMLLERGLGDSPLFSIKETVVDSNGMLPAETVASIKDWLIDLAADAEARAAVVRRTLHGAVTAMVKKTPAFAAAVRAQAETVIELRSTAETAYDRAVKDVAKATQDGTMLRGEVLARWQEFVGTGELLKGLQTNVGRLRDKMKATVVGKPPPTRDLNDAVESGLESLLREHAEAAAERAEESWQSTAPGRQLLAAGDRDMGRMSKDFPAAAGRAVRDWQGFVLDLVRKEGADKRSTARILAYGVNGLGLSLMVVIFASTAGITGAEVGVGAGTAVVGQKLLEAVFGDQAVRTLVAKAREDLDGRVHALMDAEFARYLAVLDQHPVDPEAARQLTEAARAVEDCT